MWQDEKQKNAALSSLFRRLIKPQFGGAIYSFSWIGPVSAARQLLREGKVKWCCDQSPSFWFPFQQHWNNFSPEIRRLWLLWRCSGIHWPAAGAGVGRHWKTTSESWVSAQAEDSKPDENVRCTLFKTFSLKHFCVEEITAGQLLDQCISHAHGECEL